MNLNHPTLQCILLTPFYNCNVILKYQWVESLIRLPLQPIYFIVTLLFCRLDALRMIFVILGGCMAALGLMILFVGFLATGATRVRVYRAWTARVSGRISCAVVGFRYCIYLVTGFRFYFWTVIVQYFDCGRRLQRLDD